MTCCAISQEEWAPIEGPTRITHARPEWMKQGMVIAGSWTTPFQRKQKRIAPWTQLGYGLTDEQAEEAYRNKEFTPEMADRLKELEVTFVLLPLWAGASFETEFPGMEDTKRFSKILHDRGMKVGVYIHQGRLEIDFLEARPDAIDWLAWKTFDKPPQIEKNPNPDKMAPSYSVNRNHPGYQKFMRRLVKYAIEEVEADLVHFDNYTYQVGKSPWVMEDFRDYLRRKFTPAELQEYFGGEQLRKIDEMIEAELVPVAQEWVLFQAWVLGESYRKLADYARSLRPDVAVNCNASGFGVRFRAANYGGGALDLSQLVPFGDSFADEQGRRGWDPEKSELTTNIRTYKLARMYHQNMFTYTPRLVTNCESLAFNYNSQSHMYWFQYGLLNWACTADFPADDRRMPETRFFLNNRDLFDSGETLTDVAVLRGRAVNLYGPEEAYSNAFLFEQALITGHLPFEIIFDQHLYDLTKYRVVVLPDVRMMDDHQIENALRYVEKGGGLVVTDQTAIQDNWTRPRSNSLGRFFRGPIKENGLTVEDRGQGRMVYVQISRPEEFSAGSLPLNEQQLVDSVIKAMGSEPSFRVEAPKHVGIEFIRQKRRVLLNLVDYSRAIKIPRDLTTRKTYFVGISMPPRGTPQPGSPTGPIGISASDTLGRVAAARFMSPRKETIELPVHRPGSNTEIIIPSLDVYGVLVLDLQ